MHGPTNINLPKVSSEVQLLIFHKKHPSTLHLHEQESEDPRLFFEAAKGPRTETSGKQWSIGFTVWCHRDFLKETSYSGVGCFDFLLSRKSARLSIRVSRPGMNRFYHCQVPASGAWCDGWTLSTQLRSKSAIKDRLQLKL